MTYRTFIFNFSYFLYKWTYKFRFWLEIRILKILARWTDGIEKSISKRKKNCKCYYVVPLCRYIGQSVAHVGMWERASCLPPMIFHGVYVTAFPAGSCPRW